MKLVGITLAGEAFCGNAEHIHDESCTIKSLNCDYHHEHDELCYDYSYSCGLDEHIHIETCYSDISADLETPDDWEMTLADIPRELSLSEKISAIANTQLGYIESESNFIIDSEGVRRGYTRYGEWYGNPYGEWSTMFTSFCLSYAGADVPLNSGADAMRLEWQEQNIYKTADSYTPIKGDIVFIDKNENTTIDSTAIIVSVSTTSFTVIEGDRNDQVTQSEYNIDDTRIIGFGIILYDANLHIVETHESGNTYVAKTTNYNQNLFIETNNFVIYSSSGSDYYAFDGNGNAVQIFIDSSGTIIANIDNPDILLWSITSSGGTNSYLIRNVSSGRYMHAYPNNGTGVTTSGAYTSVISVTGNGINIKSNNEYAKLNVSSGIYQMTQSQSEAAVYSLGVVSKCTVWLDGTNGGLMGLGGSPNKSYSIDSGNVIKLPTEWQSPEKYDYVLQGWYDVKNSKYYKAGSEITVQENLVLYADWIASSYDVGKFNTNLADTVSTNSFITTNVFDYNSLFNVMSQNATVTASSSGHSETWSIVKDGIVSYNNADTLDFVFIDYDSTGDISYASGRGANNGNGNIYSGIYSDELSDILFNTENSYNANEGTGVIGKKHLGTADHLFSIMDDPTNENYGYYYYDSKLNAASYSQKDGRFYVYNYLERTADSEKDGGAGGYSDFLPFNSPYANTNNKNLATYTYSGEHNEHNGTSHYQYDAKYNSYNNSVSNVGTNYWFGMSLDIDFYLSSAPGTLNSNGEYGNKDINHNDMHFKFSGDDDMWVLLDGKLVLDIGGIHGIESGDINFSTGEIYIDGSKSGTLDGFSKGSHTLTVYYLERGSSQSNCAIYFNLEPRFTLNLQKEDMLYQTLLNGAEFSVYTDRECTVPAELWNNREDFDNKLPSKNVLTVKDGLASMWGFVADETYYIKETKPPDREGYIRPYGIISVTIRMKGATDYNATILPELDENGNVIEITEGFTVYSFKIDVETQQLYIIITNTIHPVEEKTAVHVFKQWEDDLDHSSDSINVYLTVTETDNTIRRLQNIKLSADNEWEYTWTNLPKYWQGTQTPIDYGIVEEYIPGYYSSIERVYEKITNSTTFSSVNKFTDGGEYLLKTSNGCLSTTSASNTSLIWVDESTAQNSKLATWTATINGNSVKLTNGSGHILTFNYSTLSSSRYYYATSSTVSYQSLTPSFSGTTVRLYYTRTRNYYMSSLNSNGRASITTSSGSALTFTPLLKETVTETENYENIAYKVTNIPLNKETSVKVTKKWDVGMGDSELFEQQEITIHLFANGSDTGRTVVLNLKNSWSDTFSGLPYTDVEGNIIAYTVKEDIDSGKWRPSYGEIISLDGDPPTYETTVTNAYTLGFGYELPDTGGSGRTIWILSGFTLMLTALICLYIKRRRR